MIKYFTFSVATQQSEATWQATRQSKATWKATKRSYMESNALYLE